MVMKFNRYRKNEKLGRKCWIDWGREKFLWLEMYVGDGDDGDSRLFMVWNWW